jgi:hypothetical protein
MERAFRYESVFGAHDTVWVSNYTIPSNYYIHTVDVFLRFIVVERSVVVPEPFS